MPYPEHLVTPMRAELTRLGVQELTSADEVTEFFGASADGTAVLVVNSVCGCAAANARPAVAMVSQLPDQPDRWGTVFAGQDLAATAQARVHMMGIPPSSPAIALFREGDPVFVMERRHIEGRSAAAIATDLAQAIQRHCAPDALPSNGSESPEAEKQVPDGLPSTFRSIL
jgi:bacilliredoxin